MLHATNVHSWPCDGACDGGCGGGRPIVGLSIHLLGHPRMELGGAPLPDPRGHKAWGLLAYLLRSPTPPSRERMAGLLFPEADDPLGALRWTLSTLRRRLGDQVELGGDPLRLALPVGTFIDVDVLARGSWLEAISVPGLGHTFLDGVSVRSSPGFEMWLDSERRHVAGTTGALLHQAALALLARGETAGALRHAATLVELNPYDENAHVLLVRCLRAAGDADAAARHVVACTERFRRDLGVEPTAALRAAATAAEVTVSTRIPGRAAVRAQVEAGEAALAAGAVDAGLHQLRSAVAAGRRLDDAESLSVALVALGGALVQGARGTDEEGAAALHEGAALAEQVDLRDVAAKGWRLISWVQFLRAHYERAEESLSTTAALAAGNDEEIAWVDLIRGACRHDVGDHPAAGALLRSAVERADRLDKGQPLGQALTMLGRFHLLRGELDAAGVALDAALRLTVERGMTAFAPWPESFRAELDLVLGDIDAAEARFEHAFALGCQVGDPCWESIALRGLGLVAAARGDMPRALEMLVDARQACRRLPDTYLWIEAYGLSALCSVAVDHVAGAAGPWIDELEAIAARRGIRELLLRALVCRARLGEPGALSGARALAAQIDNPALDRLFRFTEPIPATTDRSSVPSTP